MKKKDDIIRLDFSDEQLMDSAEKRYEEGDYLGALTMLNKRAELYDPSADASALYADTYEALGLYSMSADAWFRFLDTCNEADFSEGYEGLGTSFMNMGEDEQADMFFRRAFDAETEAEDFPMEFEELSEEEPPKFRLVYSADGQVDDEADEEQIRRAAVFLRNGNTQEAQKELAEISQKSTKVSTAARLSAYCSLAEGDFADAEEKCRRLVADRPDDVPAWAMYCSVLCAAKKTDELHAAGKTLASLKADSPNVLYHICSVLCDCGLYEMAYDRLCELFKETSCFADTLWLYAVCNSRLGKTDEAISALSRLTTIYPGRAYAKYVLGRLRRGEETELTNAYTLSPALYKEITRFFLEVNGLKGDIAENYADSEDVKEYFCLAFDHYDNTDEKLVLLAAEAAVKCRCDGIVREVLLDYEVDSRMKLQMLHSLTMRNEDNSFGVVLFHIYHEYFTHKLEIDMRRHRPFLRAFANVYCKYSVLTDDNEERILNTAGDIYETLCDEGVDSYFGEEAEMTAVLIRECRFGGESRSLKEIAEKLNANLRTVKEILNYLI